MKYPTFFPLIPIILALLLCSLMASAQNLSQTVRGIIVDTDSKMPIIGAEVILLNSDPLVGSVTDIDGQSRLENISVGRINSQLSYI
ncbi:MAG: carboxypeptidase-like regulatory domain-containing protein, partial [Chitinophagales bacterium]|nr:carboxypeptidase-like regulatory domain-containing protein [Chitinophagales bacterium]